MIRIGAINSLSYGIIMYILLYLLSSRSERVAERIPLG